MFVVDANLDIEARWAGITLPRRVLDRVSLLGTLVAALAPAGAEIELWTPAAVNPARVLVRAGIALRVGSPPRTDLRWADPLAKPANDRRLALSLCALPGARAIASLDELDACTRALPGPWVGKAPWTAAGRDRARGDGGPPSGELRTFTARLLSRFGALVVEPWLARSFDVGVCAGSPPHTLLTDARGGFTGISLAPPPLLPAERDTLDAHVAAAAVALAALGYAGPFTIDAFVYTDGSGARAFHPLCEINARLSFGAIARALGGSLGFSSPAPPGARTLIAPGDDGVTAWCLAP